MDPEELLASRGRVRILRVLFNYGTINITRLVRETRLHYKLVEKHLEILKREGIIFERRYGRMRLIEVNLRDPRVAALREILRSLEML